MAALRRLLSHIYPRAAVLDFLVFLSTRLSFHPFPGELRGKHLLADISTPRMASNESQDVRPVL